MPQIRIVDGIVVLILTRLRIKIQTWELRWRCILAPGSIVGLSGRVGVVHGVVHRIHREQPRTSPVMGLAKLRIASTPTDNAKDGFLG
jgi:hypothetical protein